MSATTGHLITHVLSFALPMMTLACEGPPAPPGPRIYDVANGCYALAATDAAGSQTSWLAPTLAGDGFAFSAPRTHSRHAGSPKPIVPTQRGETRRPVLPRRR